MFKTVTTVSTLLLFLLLHCIPAMAAEQKILKNISFASPSEGVERITFSLNELNIPKIFAMKGEKPRVVFDFQETKPSRLLKNTINTNGKFIKRIRVGIHNEPTRKTRVVFDLMPDQDVDFKQNFDKENNALIISVFQANTGSSPPPAPRKTVQQEGPQTAATSRVKTPQAPAPAAAPETVEPVITGQLPAAEEEQQQDAAETEVQPSSPVPPAAEQQETATVQQEALPPAAPTPTQPEASAENDSQPTDQGKKEKTAAKTEKTQQKPAAESGSSPTVQPLNKVEIARKPVRKLDAPILTSVTFDNSTNRGEMVMFQLNTFHPPIVFGVDEGQPRVVCDFKETAAAEDLPAVIAAKGKLIRSIRIGKETNPLKVRVVLDLTAAKKYDLQQVFFKEDNLFVLIVNTLGSTPVMDGLKPFTREQID